MSLLLDLRGQNVVVAHAHPDDETLATGALLAEIASAPGEVHVVTATRGERGELMPGLPGRAADLVPGSWSYVAYREGELAAALSALGIRHHAFLGQPPARAEGLPSRSYADSGMRWVSPGVAGPAADVGADAFTAAGVGEAAGDLAAYLRAADADLVISYDAGGGYHHPDHVRMHEVAKTAARECGLTFLEVIPPGRDDIPGDLDTIEWTDLSRHLPTVQTALRAHASQVQVEGGDVVHVGGQREPIVTRVGLRRA